MTQTALPRPTSRRLRSLTIAIDVERDTRWALLELLYGLQRDARRRWRLTRSRRWWRVLVWALGTITTYSLGAVADHRWHVLEELLQRLG
jgi:hypothetical protein